MKYKAPETIEECEQRIAELKGEESMLLAQLADPSRLSLPVWQYHKWKSATLERKALIIREHLLLKAWKKSEQQKRADAIAAEKARVRAALQEEGDRKDAVILNAASEAQIIHRLFVIVARLTKKGLIERTDELGAVLDAAREYLVKEGLFDA